MIFFITFVKICENMSRDFQSRLQSLSAKMTVIVQRHRALEESYRAAHEEIIELKAAVLARDKEIEQLRLKAEYLAVASTVGADRANVEATRSMLANMVREIDRCIADLME